MQVKEIVSSFSNTSKMRYYYANTISVVGVKCPIYFFIITHLEIYQLLGFKLTCRFYNKQRWTTKGFEFLHHRTQFPTRYSE